MLLFTSSGGVWTTDTDVDYKLTSSGTTWTLTDPDDTVETYVTNTGGYAPNASAQLTTIKLRNGFTKSLTYNTLGQLSTVIDSYSRSLTFSYNSTGQLSSITTPDSTTVTYGYTAAGPTQNLTSVTFPTSSSPTLTYVYGSSSLPYALTGVLDDNNGRYLTWTYDAYGRALTSSVGTGSSAKVTTVTYNDTNGSRTVTNALGETDTFSYSTLQNAQKLTQISRAATSTTAAATRTFTYDSNGYLASKTDWNGNQTTYVNNSHGLPTTINEAVSSSVARTTTIAYDTTWTRLPHTITTPGLTTTLTYDSYGEQLTKVLADTTTTTIPYSTNGQTRTWTNTWSNSLLASVETPNLHTTSFGYDSSGAMISITDALSHVTHINAHTGGGLPETIVDPNSVTTTKTYDGRQRLTASTVSTAGGARTTSWGYYPGGDVYTQYPDGYGFFSLLDTAHRYYGISDDTAQQQVMTLDANGDPVVSLIQNSSGGTFYRTATFDALGRKLKDTSYVTGGSYVNTFDNVGNTLTTTDPLSHSTTRLFDALNRLYKTTDANSGITQTTFDAHNRALTVVDPNGNTTSYVYNGFGDVIQEASPDRGTIVYRYDADSNLTQKVDAASVTVNHTYDPLDRILTTAYPADSTENVAYTYDQTGSSYGKGIGRLTSLTDAAGSLTRSYDERGNILTGVRTNATHTYTTTYTYDPNSRVASITYPSGSVVTYGRDSTGRVNSVAAQAPGYSNVTLASGITYKPFGPVTAITAFNGDSEAFTFDYDYRMGSLITTATNGGQHQTFTYDSANNLTAMADTVCTGCSATYHYDVINRVTSATGWFGSSSYSRDKNGNFLTYSDGYPGTYSYVSGTNHINTITVGGTAYPASYNANGNLLSFTSVPGETTTLTYNKANQLATEVMNTFATNGYDAFGQRFSKTDNGYTPTLYFYDQSGNTMEEIDGGTSYDYIWLGNRLIGTLTPSTNTLAFVHGDNLGSPLIATDKNALISDSFRYSVYGGNSAHSSQAGAATITQNNRYPGQFLEPETYMLHNGYRDYSPSMGQYVQADHIGLKGGTNLYAYAAGNPLTFTDKYGLICSSDIPGSSDSTYESNQGPSANAPSGDLDAWAAALQMSGAFQLSAAILNTLSRAEAINLVMGALSISAAAAGPTNVGDSVIQLDKSGYTETLNERGQLAAQQDSELGRGGQTTEEVIGAGEGASGVDIILGFVLRYAIPIVIALKPSPAY